MKFRIFSKTLKLRYDSMNLIRVRHYLRFVVYMLLLHIRSYVYICIIHILLRLRIILYIILYYTFEGIIL